MDKDESVASKGEAKDNNAPPNQPAEAPAPTVDEDDDDPDYADLDGMVDAYCFPRSQYAFTNVRYSQTFSMNSPLLSLIKTLMLRRPRAQAGRMLTQPSSHQPIQRPSAMQKQTRNSCRSSKPGWAT